MSENTINQVPAQTPVSSSPPQQSISDAAVATGIATMDYYGNDVQDYYDKVHQDNIEMQNMNNAEEALNAASAPCDPNDVTFEYTDPETGATQPMSVADYMDKEGIPAPPTDANGQWDQNAINSANTNINTASNTLSNTTTQDQLLLQQSLNKYNAAAQLFSNIVKEMADTCDKISQKV